MPEKNEKMWVNHLNEFEKSVISNLVLFAMEQAASHDPEMDKWWEKEFHPRIGATRREAWEIFYKFRKEAFDVEPE